MASLSATVASLLSPNPNFPSGYSLQVDTAAFDFLNNRAYFAIADSVNGGISVVNLSTMQEIATYTITQMYAGTAFDSSVMANQHVWDICCGNNTDIYLLGNPGAIPEYNHLIRIDRNTFKVTGDFYVSSAAPPPVTCVYGRVGVVNTTGQRTVVAYISQDIFAGTGAGPIILDGTNMGLIGSSLGADLTYNNIFSIVMVPGFNSATSCDFWLVNPDVQGSSGNIVIFKHTVTETGGGATLTSTSFTVNVASFFPGNQLLVTQALYDRANNALIIWVGNNDSSTPTWIISVSLASQSIKWTLGPLAGTGVFQSRGYGYTYGDYIMIPYDAPGSSGGQNISTITTASGSLANIGPATNQTILFNGFFVVFDSQNNWYFSYDLGMGFVRYNYVPTYVPATLQEQSCLTRCDRVIMAHLYTLTSNAGLVGYFTDFDIDIVYKGITWISKGLRFEGLRRKVGVGLSVDEQTLKIWASPTDTLWGAQFLRGAEEGLLDGAVIIRQRIVWEFQTGNVAVDIQNPPICVFTLFTGYTAEIVKGGASHVEFKVKSALVKLDVNMPRNYWQPGCLWTLYSQPGCGLLKSNYLNTGAAVAATYNSISPAGGVPNPTGADSLPTFAQGRIMFTSGINDGLETLIDTNDSLTLYLAYPLDNTPEIGDTFNYYPGCSKSFATCGSKFNNTANFRGFDKVPPVMISI